MSAFFSAIGVSRRFGGLKAVDDVSFTVEENEMYGVIGPNGAGKSTLLNCVSGVLGIDKGSVTLGGRQLAGVPPHKVAARGVSRTFQLTEHFKTFTLAEFVMLGRLAHRSRSIWRCGLSLGVGGSERREQAVADGLLERFKLDGFRNVPLTELSYGTQKMADLIRAVASEPQLLLLDEPTSGSSESERMHMREVMAELQMSGLTTIVVDHDVSFIGTCCDRVLAMAAGAEIATGTAAQVLSHPDVVASYLGADDAEAAPAAVVPVAGRSDAV
jgi:branched-chain amino acid transport system ATP-binding protein